MPHTRQESYTKRRLYQPWRYAKLSHNRRYLHYADFPDKLPYEPGLDALTEKVDLGTISSVVSNVSANPESEAAEAVAEADHVSNASTTTLRHNGAAVTKPTTKITIYSFADDNPVNPNPSTSPDATTTTIAGAGAATTPGGASTNSGATEAREQPVLTLYPLNHSLASEWLDGLLMLLSQAPITAETNKLVSLVSEYGLKIRLLNVRLEQMYAGPEGRGAGVGVVPSREGLDEEYFYEN
jgi:hypothetical protein